MNAEWRVIGMCGCKYTKRIAKRDKLPILYCPDCEKYPFSTFSNAIIYFFRMVPNTIIYQFRPLHWSSDIGFEWSVSMLSLPLPFQSGSVQTASDSSPNRIRLQSKPHPTAVLITDDLQKDWNCHTSNHYVSIPYSQPLCTSFFEISCHHG